MGKNLAMRFAAGHLLDAYNDVCRFFRKLGAYGRFKELLERSDRLGNWYEYEAQEIEQALREFSRENQINLDR